MNEISTKINKHVLYIKQNSELTCHYFTVNSIQYTKPSWRKGTERNRSTWTNLEPNNHNSLRENGHTRKIIINRNILLFVNNKSIDLYM